MSTATLSVSQNVFQRLHELSARAGEPAETVLDRALAAYAAKLLAGGCQGTEPRTAFEAELLDDPGRIRLPPRDVQAVTARVVAAGRLPGHRAGVVRSTRGCPSAANPVGWRSSDGRTREIKRDSLGETNNRSSPREIRKRTESGCNQWVTLPAMAAPRTRISRRAASLLGGPG